MSDSALSDMAPLTYAVTLHKTFGWKLPHEDKTRANLLGRQKEDGGFYHVVGTGDAKAPLTRLYNTTQGLVALHALGAKPRSSKSSTATTRSCRSTPPASSHWPTSSWASRFRPNTTRRSGR
jgi:hypothetical protein